jgi:DNA polymerase sigma
MKIIKIDLTFGNIDITTKQVDYVRLNTLKYPELIPITKILKNLFRKKNLNISFNGGLSSYSLFLIILAFVKIHRINNTYINLAKLLFDLLMYYGNYYDFKTSLIDVNLDKYIILNQPLCTVW